MAYRSLCGCGHSMIGSGVSTLRRIVVVVVRAPGIGNDGYGASSAAALAHRKELPMKGDMGQENRQALDINLDSVASYSCELGLMSIAAHLLKDGCTDMGSFVVSPACLYIAIETLTRAPKAKRLTSSNRSSAARRRVAIPVPCCLRNVPNKLRAITALPLRHRYERTSSPLPCGETSAAQ